MASYCYGGHILMLPEEDLEEKEGRGYENDVYPFSVPKVILDGWGEQYVPPKHLCSTCTDSIITVQGNFVTIFENTSFFEFLVEDENGNTIWFDSRKVPFDDTFKYKILDEWRNADEYTIEEIDLEKKLKRVYKVMLQETAPLDDWDIRRAAAYQKIGKKSIVGDFVLNGDELIEYNGKSAEVVLPDGITSIGNGVFGGCDFIRSVAIPSSVTSIGERAFNGCAALQNITLPSSVEALGIHAFGDCSALKRITIPASVTRIGGCLFSGATDVEEIIVEDKNPKYYVEGNCIIERNANMLVCGSNRSVIHDGVTSIAEYAFYSCSGLKNIIIPDSVTSIGEEAFKDCIGLKSITIPNSVTSIGNQAFQGCRSLSEITIPNSVTSIGASAFGSCRSLAHVIIPCGVKVIEELVFSGCFALTSIDIPSSVTMIENNAFWGCGHLTEINFRGTRAQWDVIEKDEDMGDFVGEYRVYCDDDDDSLPV